VLITCFYVCRYACMLLRDRFSHSTLNRLFGCFPGMTSLLKKSKQIIERTFKRFCSTIFLSFGVPQYSNRLDYIKACDQQFTLTTKKSLHVTFKRSHHIAIAFNYLPTTHILMPANIFSVIVSYSAGIVCLLHLPTFLY